MLIRLIMSLFIGLFTLPVRLFLSLNGYSHVIPLIVVLQAILLLIFILLYKGEKVNFVLCLTVCILCSFTSYYMGGVIIDFLEQFHSAFLLKEAIVSLINSSIAVSTNGSSNFAISIDDLLNTSPTEGTRSNQGQSGSGTSSNNGQGSNQSSLPQSPPQPILPQSPPQPILAQSPPQPILAQSPNQPTNRNNLLGVAPPTGLNLSSYFSFGTSIKARCEQIALTKTPSSTGVISVTLGDLGINKRSPEYGILCHIFNNSSDPRQFARKINNNTTTTVIWSNVYTRVSPGNSIIDDIKNFHD